MHGRRLGKDLRRNGMQIFSNEQPDPLPLETDERLRLQAIHKR